MAVEQTPAPAAGQSQALGWLNEDQKKALGQLFTGYAEGMLCGKKVDLNIAGGFLKSKLTHESFTPEQLVEIVQMAVVIQRVQMDRISKQRLDRKAIEERCTKAAHDAFGPSGKVIPGLLK